LGRHVPPPDTLSQPDSHDALASGAASEEKCLIIPSFSLYESYKVLALTRT